MDNIDFIAAIIKDNESHSRNEYTICKALINTLSANELHKLQEITGSDWLINRYIEQRLAGEKVKPKPAKNENWRIYLTNMKCRKIGTVETSRAMLQSIFSTLEWKVQRQILWFFLTESTKKDRIWALKTIDYDWYLVGDCKSQERNKWMECIMDIWSKHHDSTSARIIVKNFQYPVVAAKERQLTEDLGYKHVALRLGENPDYVVQRNSMTDLDYLYVMAKLGRKVDALTAEAILTEVLLELHDSPSSPYLEEQFLSLLCDSKVNMTIWSLGLLGHSALIQDFYLKDKQLRDMALKQGMSAKICWDVMCLNIPHVFPLLRNYKQELFDRLMSEYPALRMLVEKLQLRLI